MRKFKVGDRVTVNDPSLGSERMGTVSEDRGLWYDVQLDEPDYLEASGRPIWTVGIFEKYLCQSA